MLWIHCCVVVMETITYIHTHIFVAKMNHLERNHDAVIASLEAANVQIDTARAAVVL